MSNILVVDDEQSILFLFELSFEEYPEYTLFTASSGKEAIAISKANSIDVIITDLNMPKMSGFQLLNEIKNQNIHIPYKIILSGNPLDTIKESLSDYGIDRYIEKPYDMDNLIVELKSIDL